METKRSFNAWLSRASREAGTGKLTHFPFMELPDHLRIHMLSYLREEDVLTAGCTCKELRDLIRTPPLWNHFLRQRGWDKDTLPPPPASARPPEGGSGATAVPGSGIGQPGPPGEGGGVQPPPGGGGGVGAPGGGGGGAGPGAAEAPAAPQQSSVSSSLNDGSEQAPPSAQLPRASASSKISDPRTRYFWRLKHPEAGDEIEALWQGSFNLVANDIVTAYEGRAWWEAVVVDQDLAGGRYLIHYPKWDSHVWDEWVSKDRLRWPPRYPDVLAPLHKGDRVELKCSSALGRSPWLECVIARRVDARHYDVGEVVVTPEESRVVPRSSLRLVESAAAARARDRQAHVHAANRLSQRIRRHLGMQSSAALSLHGARPGTLGSGSGSGVGSLTRRFSLGRLSAAGGRSNSAAGSPSAGGGSGSVLRRSISRLSHRLLQRGNSGGEDDGERLDLVDFADPATLGVADAGARAADIETFEGAMRGWRARAGLPSAGDGGGEGGGSGGASPATPGASSSSSSPNVLRRMSSIGSWFRRSPLQSTAPTAGAGARQPDDSSGGKKKSSLSRRGSIFSSLRPRSHSVSSPARGGSGSGGEEGEGEEDGANASSASVGVGEGLRGSFTPVLASPLSPSTVALGWSGSGTRSRPFSSPLSRSTSTAAAAAAAAAAALSASERAGLATPASRSRRSSLVPQATTTTTSASPQPADDLLQQDSPPPSDDDITTTLIDLEIDIAGVAAAAATGGGAGGEALPAWVAHVPSCVLLISRADFSDSVVSARVAAEARRLNAVCGLIEEPDEAEVAAAAAAGAPEPPPGRVAIVMSSRQFKALRRLDPTSAQAFLEALDDKLAAVGLVQDDAEYGPVVLDGGEEEEGEDGEGGDDDEEAGEEAEDADAEGGEQAEEDGAAGAADDGASDGSSRLYNSHGHASPPHSDDDDGSAGCACHDDNDGSLLDDEDGASVASRDEHGNPLYYENEAYDDPEYIYIDGEAGPGGHEEEDDPPDSKSVYAAPASPTRPAALALPGRPVSASFSPSPAASPEAPLLPSRSPSSHQQQQPAASPGRRPSSSASFSLLPVLPTASPGPASSPQRSSPSTAATVSGGSAGRLSRAGSVDVPRLALPDNSVALPVGGSRQGSPLRGEAAAAAAAPSPAPPAQVPNLANLAQLMLPADVDVAALDADTAAALEVALALEAAEMEEWNAAAATEGGGGGGGGDGGMPAPLAPAVTAAGLTLMMPAHLAVREEGDAEPQLRGGGSRRATSSRSDAVSSTPSRPSPSQAAAASPGSGGGSGSRSRSRSRSGSILHDGIGVLRQPPPRGSPIPGTPSTGGGSSGSGGRRGSGVAYVPTGSSPPPQRLIFGDSSGASEEEDEAAAVRRGGGYGSSSGGAGGPKNCAIM